MLFARDFYQQNANFHLGPCRAEILIPCYGFLCQIAESSIYYKEIKGTELSSLLKGFHSELKLKINLSEVKFV